MRIAALWEWYVGVAGATWRACTKTISVGCCDTSTANSNGTRSSFQKTALPCEPGFPTPGESPGLTNAGAGHERGSPRFRKWALQDLNLGPTDYESAALTAELRARTRA